MSSLFNVYKKISKKYSTNYNTRYNSPFQYIPILSNKNKNISQIKNDNNNILNFSEQNPQRFFTHLSKSNTCSKFLSQISNEETKNTNNIKHETNLTRYNNYFITSHLLKNKYISDITNDKSNKKKMEKTDHKINDMIKDLNIYQSLKSDLSNNLSTYSNNQRLILNKKNKFTNTLIKNMNNKFGIRLLHKNMSEKILSRPKKNNKRYLFIQENILLFR